MPHKRADSRDSVIERIAQNASTRMMVAFDALITMAMYEFWGWTGVAILIGMAILTSLGCAAWSIWRHVEQIEVDRG